MPAADQMQLRFSCRVGKLYEQGKIQDRYSAHDLRHAFSERNAARSPRWLQRRLGHSAIAITERYLRNTLAL